MPAKEGNEKYSPEQATHRNEFCFIGVWGFLYTSILHLSHQPGHSCLYFRKCSKQPTSDACLRFLRALFRSSTFHWIQSLFI